jgi:predicted GTPase
VSEDVEFYSVLRSVRAIEDADVCLLLIDAAKGVQAQDLSIFHLIEKNKKGLSLLSINGTSLKRIRRRQKSWRSRSGAK